MGNGVATVARSTPGWMPSRTVEAASTAPVLPAETNASEAPAFWRPSPTTTLELGFLRDRGEGLFAHADHFGGGHDLEAAPVDGGMTAQLGLDHVHLAHQLHQDVRQQRERRDRTLDLSLRGVISAHRVQRHANHVQSPLTSTTFLPR